MKISFGFAGFTAEQWIIFYSLCFEGHFTMAALQLLAFVHKGMLPVM